MIKNANSTHDRILARLNSEHGCDAFCTFPDKTRVKAAVLDYDQQLNQFLILFCRDSRRGLDHLAWVDASWLS